VMRYVSLGLLLLAVCGFAACLVGAAYYGHRWMYGGPGARDDDHETEFTCSCLAVVMAAAAIALTGLVDTYW